MAFDATVGGAAANSFADIAFWTQYWTDRNEETLVDTDEEIVKAALIYATADIDQSWDWDGIRATIAQRLGWPRSGAQQEDHLDVISISTIPDVVKAGTCEEARMIIEGNHPSIVLDPEAALRRLKVGPIDLEWDRDGNQPGPVGNPFVQGLLSQVGTFVGSGASVAEIVRG